MDNATIWEWVGYLASVVVAISLMMSNIKNCAGGISSARLYLWPTAWQLGLILLP